MKVAIEIKVRLSLQKIYFKNILKVLKKIIEAKIRKESTQKSQNT
jgi:hypothetical protein